MADGYGFGAEGDWKTAALVRIVKVMAAGIEGGTSFMEDYTYHLAPDQSKVLGAHMLEVCPSIAAARPSCEIHPLSIGGKPDPVRLVFTAAPGPAVVVSLLDLGEPLPGGRERDRRGGVRTRSSPGSPSPEPSGSRDPTSPPRPGPGCTRAARTTRSSHRRSGSSRSRTSTEMAQIELLVIDDRTRVPEFKKELRWNQAYYHLARGL